MKTSPGYFNISGEEKSLIKVFFSVPGEHKSQVKTINSSPHKANKDKPVVKIVVARHTLFFLCIYTLGGVGWELATSTWSTLGSASYCNGLDLRLPTDTPHNNNYR